MENDIEKIKNLYFDNGYIKVIVAEPEIKIEKAKKGMTITIGISEGKQYRISAIDITGNKVYDTETLMKKVTIRPGSVFNKSDLEKDIQAISSLYSDNGYALVSVVPDLIPSDKDATVRVTLNISEGDRYRIGRIEISGNTKTRDKVIRREMRLDEGDIFDGSKLKRSYQRINNLNFFETVDIIPKPQYKEKVVNLDVKVKERATGFLSIGGGYSSVDKFIGTVDLTQGNLFGRGQYLNIKAELGGKGSLYQISFKDPYFLDTQLLFSTGIYKSNHDYIEYTKKAFGVFFDFGKNLSEYLKADLAYNFERAEVTGIAQGASPVITDQAGTKTTSAVTPTLVRDSRDNYLDPSSGSRNELSFTFAGLGGDNEYIKGKIDSAWYFPIGRTAIMVRGRFGYEQGIFGKQVPLYERFYVGGIYTVRGLDFGEAGPKDPATNDPIGGTTELVFNTEYIFPLLAEMKLKGLVFADAGSSYDNFQDFGTLRYTSGAGIRWMSPMGPIRIEWGYNIQKKEGESSSKFEFAFGSFF
jgi:outer membrane protein insertion porin family